MNKDLVLQSKEAELLEVYLALLAWNTLGRPHDHLYGLQGQGQVYEQQELGEVHEQG